VRLAVPFASAKTLSIRPGAEPAHRSSRWPQRWRGRRGQRRPISIAAGARASAGVSRGGKAPRGFVVGRLLDALGKEIARSAAPAGRLPTRAKSPSVPGQSVKTGSSLAAMRVSSEEHPMRGLAVAVAAITSPPQGGTTPCARVARRHSGRRRRGPACARPWVR